MKSKRKEINKYNFKSHEQPKESEIDEYLRRTSGIKPFQLTKLRQAQRFSMDLAHTNNEILHKRIGSNNLYDDEKEAYLDLIIKQKLLVNGNANQKLESERKDIVTIDQENQETYEGKMSPQLESNPQILEENEEEIYKVYTSQTPQSDSIERNGIQTFNVSKEVHSPSQEEKRIEEAAKNEIRLMKQKALPPFSFTSTKWRSKSQILQIDKWKQKYGKDIHQKHQKIIQKTASLSKMENNKSRVNRMKEVKSYIHSLQNQKVSLPILRKQKQLESRAKFFKFTSKSAKNEEEAVKIRINSEADPYFLLSQDTLKRKSSDSKKKHSQQTQKVEITIKKMYETQENIQKPIVPETKEDTEKRQEAQSPTEKTQKPKKKKSKFPQIQITTFYSTKEQEIQKRRIKLESIQRISREWRYHPPKKVYLEKMMEEIPERWEYGESRGSSRGGEVDTYLKIKEEQAKVEKSQKDIEMPDIQLQIVQIKH